MASLSHKLTYCRLKKLENIWMCTPLNFTHTKTKKIFPSLHRILHTSCVIRHDKMESLADQLSHATRKKPRNAARDKTFTDKLVKKMDLPSDVGVYVENHPAKLGRKMKVPDSLYVLHKELAKLVVSYVSEDPANEKAMVFEANPGPGVLTEALLKANLPSLRVFEMQREFIPYLKRLEEQYPGKLQVLEEDFLKLAKIVRRDLISGQNTFDMVFKDVQHCEWVNDPPLKIVSVLSPVLELQFMRYILRCLSKMESIYRFGRTELLVFMSGKEYMYMTASANDNYWKYRSTSVMYQILFDIQILHKEPRHSFFPPAGEESQKRVKQNEYDVDNLYLIRLTPKRHLFDLISPEEMVPFWFFVRQHMQKRTGLIIPALEAWIPNCGIRLIKEGCAFNAKFGELTPHQILALFLHFSSWPEYKECAFLAAMRRSTYDLYDPVGHDDDEELSQNV